MQNDDLTDKSRTLWNINNLFSYMKMGREILTFGNTESEKNKFYHHKTPNFGGDVDIEEVLIPNNISCGEKSYKYFIVLYFKYFTCIMVIKLNH